MNQGQLVPDNVTIHMLEAEVNQHPDAKGFIFDGFPRTTAQAESLDAFLASRGEVISGMLSLEVPESELKERLMKRAETSGRPDDADPAVVAKRIAVYHEETAPVAKFYAGQSKLQVINGVGSLEDITNRLRAAIDAL
jgi:adenylate kinase